MEWQSLSSFFLLRSVGSEQAGVWRRCRRSCGSRVAASGRHLSGTLSTSAVRSPKPDVLGAAVYDDVIGLVILSDVGGIVSGVTLSFWGVAGTTSVAIRFIALALILGRLLVPPVFRFIARVEAAGTLGVAGLAFAFLLAWLASLAGSATIIGAFAAGFSCQQRLSAPHRELHDVAGPLFVRSSLLSSGLRSPSEHSQT